MTTEAEVQDECETAECDICGSDAPLEDMVTTLQDERACQLCVGRTRGPVLVWCDNQDGWSRRDSAVRAADSREWATEDYAQWNWVYSDHAEEWFEDIAAREDWERENGFIADIHGYHDVDAVAHLGWPRETPEDSLCMGVELEMEHAHSDGEDGRAELCEILGGKNGNGKYVLMTDGSLNDSGVELVTVPYTLAGHRSVFQWDSILTPALQRKARSGARTTACGMHVHVNRRAPVLTPLTVGKLLVFVNAPANTGLIETIAQRSGSDYARRYAKSVTDGLDPHSAQETRYEALNFTHRTIEFRIFRGNLRPDRVYKNLEFVEAAILFCRDAAVDRLGANAFCAWLGKHRSQYPNLYKFLVEKSYIGDFKTLSRTTATKEA